jgi:GxxExxY protein
MGYGEDTSPEIERIAKAVVDSALKVHRQLGPGLLESAYRACLAYELTKRGFAVEQEQAVPVLYDGVKIDVGYKLDLLVNGLVIVELKAVAVLLPVHKAQLLTHQKLRRLRLGLLINFNVVLVKEGIRRVLNDSP